MKLVLKGYLITWQFSWEHYILVFDCGNDQLRRMYGLPNLFPIWMYNLYTEQWSKHVINGRKRCPPLRRYACAVAISDDVYMFGGCEPGSLIGPKPYGNLNKSLAGLLLGAK